jgi:hypothetical protein
MLRKQHVQRLFFWRGRVGGLGVRVGGDEQLPIVVMARFIRATQPKASTALLRFDIGMGHPDKPGDDDLNWSVSMGPGLQPLRAEAGMTR